MSRVTPEATGPLKGLRVIELGVLLAGPFCGQLLGDLGAEVIKIEPPGQGDPMRDWGTIKPEGQGLWFSIVARNKKCITADMRTPEGQQILKDLVAEADFVLENFRPGTMEKWGLGYESVLADQFPKLIYCNISGFGKTGPLGGLPGYDAVLQAMCGVMSINGSAASGPTRVGVPIVDQMTGYTAFSGVLMALHARSRTHRGQRVEATLFDTALSMLVPHGVNWMTSGVVPELIGSAHPNIPTYDRFDVGDGQMFLGIVNDAQFVRFCKLIDREDLCNDPLFQTNSQRMANRSALRNALGDALKHFSRAKLCQDLMEAGVPAGPVNTVAEAMQQPHASARDMLIERPDYRGIGLPIKLSGTPGQVGCRPPRLGEHNDEIIKNRPS
jgi:crotonobetainyl-CoA:carnitine CoA-transferase CaiB-like acyl-CoA transferase